METEKLVNEKMVSHSDSDCDCNLSDEADITDEILKDMDQTLVHAPAYFDTNSINVLDSKFLTGLDKSSNEIFQTHQHQKPML